MSCESPQTCWTVEFINSYDSNLVVYYLTFRLHSLLKHVIQLSSGRGRRLLSPHHRLKGTQLTVLLSECEVFRRVSSHLWVMFHLKRHDMHISGWFRHVFWDYKRRTSGFSQHTMPLKLLSNAWWQRYCHIYKSMMHQVHVQWTDVFYLVS